MRWVRARPFVKGVGDVESITRGADDAIAFVSICAAPTDMRRAKAVHIGDHIDMVFQVSGNFHTTMQLRCAAAAACATRASAPRAHPPATATRRALEA